MKKTFLLLLVSLFTIGFLKAENFTLYTGKTSGHVGFAGVSAGGDVWHFLHLQFDFFKYLQQDQSLHSGIPEENRGDFLGASINFVIKIPIHFIPYLDKLDFIQPYILTGYGYGLENLAGEYLKLPDKYGNTNWFTKLRQFDSFGYGLILMLSPKFGIKVDYRSIRLPEQDRMGYYYRKFNRLSVGLCFGSYKHKLKK